MFVPSPTEEGERGEGGRGEGGRGEEGKEAVTEGVQQSLEPVEVARPAVPSSPTQSPTVTTV